MFQYRFTKAILYPPKMHEMLNTTSGMVGKHVRTIGEIIVNRAKAQVGVKTGALRDSIHMRHLANYTGHYLWIGSNKNYAYAHHEGTKPHVITPNPPNKVLVFRAGSMVVRTAEVKHPGTRPNRYLSDQLRNRIR
jgi:hypothetical protein